MKNWYEFINITWDMKHISLLFSDFALYYQVLNEKNQKYKNKRTFGNNSFLIFFQLKSRSCFKFCTNFCKAIKPKTGYSLFVYYYWKYLYEKGTFFSYENGTTGIKNLDFNGFIETEPIIIPPFDRIIAFNNYSKSIFDQIFANGRQSEQLAILRDTLLPRLMNGEIDVSEVEI